MEQRFRYSLVKVTSESEWREYHSIRRRVLWEQRGLVNYDDGHPDEHIPTHHPLLLKLEGEAIGTVRLDDRGDGRGVVRLVAIETALQRQGHGRLLSELTEDYARNLGMTQLYVNATPESVGYYERLGWQPEVWDQAELVGAASVCSQMSKSLGPPRL